MSQNSIRVYSVTDSVKKNVQQILQSQSWKLDYFSIKKYKTWEVCMEVLYPFSITYIKVPSH